MRYKPLILWLWKIPEKQKGKIILLTFYKLLSTLSGLSLTLLFKGLVDQAMLRNVNSAIIYGISIAVLMNFANIMGAYVNILSTRISNSMTNRLQTDLTHHILDMDWMRINNYHTGDLLTHINSDVNNIVNGWVNSIPDIITLSIQLVFAFLLLFFFDPGLAFFAIIVGPFSLLLGWFFGKRLKKLQHQVQATYGKYQSRINETITNILIVRVFDFKKRITDELVLLQEKRSDAYLKRTVFHSLTNVFLSFGYQLGFFVSFSWGAYRLSLGTITFGTFTAFLQLVAQIQAPIEGLSRSLLAIVTTLTSAERIYHLNSEPLEVNVDSSTYSPDRYEKNQALGIDIEQLNFEYIEGHKIIKNLTLHITPGITLGIIGSSGSGKTTLLMLLMSLLKPQEGDIIICLPNGQRIVNTEDARKFFSYVPQGNTLFSGTIAENLRIAKENATDEEIITACKIACIYDYIETLDLGIYGVIGEHGFGLSEGQAQRLAIARAFLKDAPILLLDEATSALDLGTEKQVIKNINLHAPHRTCITITHRTSILEICDEIYDLSKQRYVTEEF